MHAFDEFDEFEDNESGEEIDGDLTQHKLIALLIFDF